MSEGTDTVNKWKNRFFLSFPGFFEFVSFSLIDEFFSFFYSPGRFRMNVLDSEKKFIFTWNQGWSSTHSSAEFPLCTSSFPPHFNVLRQMFRSV